MSEHFDVLVVGAGLSGIGAAYRLQTRCPDRSYAVLEARGASGGTWDLFRYPGVRSDSDVYTLSYPFRPWKGSRSIADGGSILDYIRATARENGIDRNIRYHHRVVSASWSSEGSLWTLQVDTGEGARTYTCSFLYLCSGYYRYDRGREVEFPGREDFRGRVVHPQKWPADLDHTGQKVVVIGSGATAVTLVPAMAEKAEHVTMVQRSPSYVLSLPGESPDAKVLQAKLPAKLAHRLVRTRAVLGATLLYQVCRRWPRFAAGKLRELVAKELPESVPVDPSFTPSYDPWDQRLCIVPDADLFRALRSGKADVVTSAAEAFTPRGVRTASGQELEADLVVTATGLELQPFGGIAVDVDGEPVESGSALSYKGMMFAGVPNFAWCIGYTNATWTLRADLASQYVCRLLNHMRRHGYTRAVPDAHAGMPRSELRPILDLSSGYVLRAVDRLPKQGRRWPWVLRQNYPAELLTIGLGRVDDGAMRFSRSVGETAGDPAMSGY
jgi:cation diffusion facilitator CzcD-associated flavoprotein CzcO